MHATNEMIRRAMTTAVVAGPALLLVSTLVGIAGDGLYRDAWQGAIQILAMGVWAVGIAGLGLTLARSAPRAGVLVLVVGLVAAGAGAAFGADIVQAAVNGARLTPEASPAVVVLRALGALFPVALIVAGIGLWRTGVVDARAGVLLAAGAVLFPLGRIPEVAAVTVACDVVLLVGSALVASALGSKARGPAVVPAGA